MVKQFLVEVRVESFGKLTCFSMEEIESIDNIRGGEGHEWKYPIVPGGPVNKNKAIVPPPTTMVSPKPILMWILSS